MSTVHTNFIYIFFVWTNDHERVGKEFENSKKKTTWLMDSPCESYFEKRRDFLVETTKWSTKSFGNLSLNLWKRFVEAL